MISFKASLINYTMISRIKPKNEPHIGAFVELDTQSKDDFIALQTIAKNWENGFSLAQDIYSKFKYDKRSSSLFDVLKHRFFALVDGNKPTKTLNPDSILGIASIFEEKEGDCILEFIQTNPEHKYGNRNRTFKHVGKALLKSIIDFVPNKDLMLFPIDKDAELFYKKNVFVKKQKSGFLKVRV